MENLLKYVGMDVHKSTIDRVTNRGCEASAVGDHRIRYFNFGDKPICVIFLLTGPPVGRKLRSSGSFRSIRAASL
jgi:hypothetical protein